MHSFLSGRCLSLLLRCFSYISHRNTKEKNFARSGQLQSNRYYAAIFREMEGNRLIYRGWCTCNTFYHRVNFGEYRITLRRPWQTCVWMFWLFVTLISHRTKVKENWYKKHPPTVLGSSDNSIWMLLVVEPGNEHIRKIYWFITSVKHNLQVIA